MMTAILKFASFLAVNSSGDYLTCLIKVELLYVLFLIIEACIQYLIFGQIFPHVLELLIGAFFVFILVVCMLACSSYNDIEKSKG